MGTNMCIPYLNELMFVMKRQHFVTCWDIIYFVKNSRENLDIPKFKHLKKIKIKKHYALD